MLKELLGILNSKQDLIEISKCKSLSMLYTSQEMVALVFNALDKNSYNSLKASISKIDQTINEMQRDVSRMVFEHLAISGVRDLIKSMQLFSVVDDIERIGDNAKNLADVLEYLPGEIIISPEYKERFKEVVSETENMFKLSVETLSGFNTATAEQIVVKYQGISRVCESIISEIVKSNGDTVKKSDLRLLMLMRYTKRINAHLRNIAQIVKEPVNLADFKK